MTVVVAIKINDGLVLAADSALTLAERNSTNVVYSYNGAEKLLYLNKKLPIGLLLYGLGTLNYFSIASVVSELRQKCRDKTSEWFIDLNCYTVKSVADIVMRFLFERYKNRNIKDNEQLTMLVAGYGHNENTPQEYEIFIKGDECKISDELTEPLFHRGTTAVIDRLYYGCDSFARTTVLKRLTDDKNPTEEYIAGAADLVSAIQNDLIAPLIIPSMPIHSAIRLAWFLIKTTIRFKAFMPGALTVYTPIDIAIITKNERFKWIKHKQYVVKTYRSENANG